MSGGPSLSCHSRALRRPALTSEGLAHGRTGQRLIRLTEHRGDRVSESAAWTPVEPSVPLGKPMEPVTAKPSHLSTPVT